MRSVSNASKRLTLALAVGLGGVGACDGGAGDTGGGGSGGMMMRDAGPSGGMPVGGMPVGGMPVGGTPAPDAATPAADLGAPPPDAATPASDAATPVADAATPMSDATTPIPDAGPPDPCDGLDLPPCPLPCVGIEPGGACAAPGAACGNEIGDSCQCADGQWQCPVHPPLGMGCNLVCRPEPPNPDPACTTACDCDPGLGCFNGRCAVGVAPVYCCDAECPADAACQRADAGYQTCRPAGACVTTSDCFGHNAPIRCPGTWDCDPSQTRMSDAPGEDGCNYTCVFNLLACNPGELCPFGDACLPCPGDFCETPNVCLDPDYAAQPM